MFIKSYFILPSLASLWTFFHLGHSNLTFEPLGKCKSDTHKLNVRLYQLEILQ